MTTWRLDGVGHPHRIEIPVGRVVSVGRAPDTDALIGDVTVSRRHAELEGLSHGLRVRDLGSSNGTSVNGARIDTADAIAGDTVTFGKVAFRLSGEAAETGESALPATVVRSVALAGAAATPTARDQAVRLARVLELAKRLSGQLELDKLIAAIVELTFELLPVDRVALLLGNAEGELVPTLTRSRIGEGAGTRVPRSIAQRAVADRAPIVTENAVADERFKSGSVMLQAVRGAICTPLLGAGDRVLGVLYVDTLTAEAPFSDDDATLLFAFGGLAAVTIGNVRLGEEVRRENEVRANFERFFAPNVAARIARERGVIGLGGERREATILFSDVRGFTPIAERMRPEDLASHLTDYFTEMADLVFEHGGTLDKFIGDALLAVWGAPISAPDDADRALRAAREMQDRLDALNRRWLAAGRPPLEIGIGLSAGEVFAGYLGSARRLEYSVMGDPVNVASRLCDDARPGEILLDQAILDRIAAPPPVERAAEIAVRGKTRPVLVYRLRR
ncbi:MAG: adenylate/guanylate cyclase domain-containing protein [Gemmatimonadales bacterium]